MHVMQHDWRWLRFVQLLAAFAVKAVRGTTVVVLPPLLIPSNLVRTLSIRGEHPMI